MSLHQNWVIGSADSCDIVVDEPTVSSQHCRVERTLEGFTIEDLGSTNGTYLNGSRVEGVAHFTADDDVTLGRTTPLPWQQIDPHHRRVRSITIGRHPDNDVVLDSPNVSARHARILVDEDRLTIEDLGSTNGTAIGQPENRIERARITAGDTVYFGSSAVPVSQLLGVGPWSNAGPATPVPASGPSLVALASCVGLLVLIAVLVVSGYYLSRDRWKHAPQEHSATGSETAVVERGGVDRQQPETPALPDPGPPADAPSGPVGKQGAGAAAGPHSEPVAPLFWVTVDDPTVTESFRAGTAWAIDPDTLVTTASVVLAARDVTGDPLPGAIAFSPATGQRRRIVAMQVHEQYEEAAAELQQIRDEYETIRIELETRTEPPEDPNAIKQRLTDLQDALLKTSEKQAYYDVGILRVDTPVDSPLTLCDAGHQLPPMRKLQIWNVGFDAQDPFFDPTIQTDPHSLECRVRREVRFGSGRNDPQRLLVECDAEQFELNLIGSPLLNATGQVVGMFVRRTPPPQLGQPLSAETFDAAMVDPIREVLSAQHETQR